MEERRAGTLAAAVLMVCAVVLSGCSGGGSKSSESKAPTPSASGRSKSSGGSAQPPAGGAMTASQLRTRRTAGLGPVLVDGAGRTLYLFKKDTSTKPTCKGACAKAWPPALAGGRPSAGSGVRSGLIGTTAGGGKGRRQVTYKGHPLYYFAEDKKRGDAEGQGSKAFGAGWYVLDGGGGTVTKKAKSSSGPGGGSSGGGGY